MYNSAMEFLNDDEPSVVILGKVSGALIMCLNLMTVLTNVL